MAESLLQDPLGRSIYLHDRTWFGHITRKGNHPEVRPHRLLVEETIRKPNLITISRSDPDRRLYCGSGPRPGIMMIVVADIVQGFVATAYLSKKSPEGLVEWSAQKP
jgi:hypothetical protein